jgi:hypothetical protein
MLGETFETEEVSALKTACIFALGEPGSAAG